MIQRNVERNEIGQEIDDQRETLLNDPHLPQILEMSREMFPGEVKAETYYDPSYPQEELLAIVVIHPGPREEANKLRDEWYRRVALVVGGSHEAQLVIYTV